MVKKWLKAFNLEDWDIKLQIVESNPPDVDGDASEAFTAIAECGSHWEYKEGYIRFYLQNTRHYDDDEMEAVIVHEFVHFHLTEMRDWENTTSGRRHEERAVSELTDTIINAYWLGYKEGEKAQRLKHTTTT